MNRTLAGAGRVVVRLLVAVGVVASGCASPRRSSARAAPVLATCLALVAGCSDKPESVAPDATAPATLGAHALVFQRIDGGRTVMATPELATQATGSTFVVSVGRGDARAFSAPTDNRGNAYQALGTWHPYTRWPSSGTAVYVAAGGTGGAGHVVSTTTPANDEVTLSVVEVKGRAVVDAQWAEVLAGTPLTSPKVTTTGPATLVAFWWGDAGVQGDKTAVPDAGFAVVDSVLASGALVQAATAVKQVTQAGTYEVTWTSTPQQGAQLYLLAVQ